MKKIMTSMLGLSLLLGAASFAFAQDTTKSTTTKKKAKTKKSTTSTSKM
jgi:uncharacterized protein YxeA